MSFMNSWVSLNFGHELLIVDIYSLHHKVIKELGLNQMQIFIKKVHHNTVGFQPSQNVIVRPWVYMSFIIIQIYFHALLFI